MKRFYAVISVLFLAIVLAACREHGVDDVKAALGELVDKLTGYEVDAVMTISENEKRYVFDVNVKYYKKDQLDLYKVTLKNRDSNNLQVILKNEEGVFILNPTLNKSFKFQSDWPLNSSQPYLLQSIVKDVVNDKNAAIVKQDNTYVIETKVDYLKSKELVKQKITIDAKTLHPKELSVYDATNKERIHVLFGTINLKPKFKETEFYVEATMQTIKEEHQDIPVLAPERPTFVPTYTIQGTTVVEPVYEGDEQTIVTITGTRHITIVQRDASYAEEMAIEVMYGDLVILKDGAALATNTMITWYKDGAMISVIADRIDDDIIRLANSLQDVETQK
ncbi:MAG TPA: hypothetical protein VIK63_01285 [Haloplasmataceae bacterium]